MSENTEEKQEYTYLDGTSAGLLSESEAADAGFCPGCGCFVAGTERESYSMLVYGLCDECVYSFDDHDQGDLIGEG